jgi:hypothetical protein
MLTLAAWALIARFMATGHSRKVSHGRLSSNDP